LHRLALDKEKTEKVRKEIREMIFNPAEKDLKHPLTIRQAITYDTIFDLKYF